jgi:hypothetical protein
MLLHTGGAGGSAHSTDLGKSWEFDLTKHSYDYTITMEGGAQPNTRPNHRRAQQQQQKRLTLTNREEPKLLLNSAGFPVALMNQASVRPLEGDDAPPPPGAGYSGPQRTFLTFTLIEPLLLSATAAHAKRATEEV